MKAWLPMTDRTEFTKKPRTPGEKMREIEERVAALADVIKESADELERRVAALEKHRDECWCNEPMPPGVAPRAEKPYLAAHADHLERRYKKEREAIASETPGMPDGVIGPGYHPLPETPGMPAGEKIYGPLPAEPPGSPTVEEAEDVRHHCVTCAHNLDNSCAKGHGIVGLHEEDGAMCSDWSRKEDGQGKSCSRCALWQPIPDSRHHEGTCGKFGRPSIEVTKADDTCGEWRPKQPVFDPYERAEQDNPRRECWEVRSARGEHQLFATSMRTVNVFMNNNPDWTRHRMVELRDWEHIVHEKTPSMWTELTAERDQLQERVKELEERLETALNDVVEQDGWRQYAEARVSVLESAMRHASRLLNEQRAALDHALDPKGGMAADG